MGEFGWRSVVLLFLREPIPKFDVRGELLKRIDEGIELRETPGGQYEVDLLDRKASPSPPGRSSRRRSTSVEARLLGEDFQ